MGDAFDAFGAFHPCCPSLGGVGKRARRADWALYEGSPVGLEETYPPSDFL
jgi:hypothetical protein